MNIQTRSIRVMVVDDNLTVLWGLGKLIQGEFPKMMLAGIANTVAEAMMFARLRPHIILLDLELEGHNSLDLIPEFRERSGGRILIHTDMPDMLPQDEAIQLGIMGIMKKGEPGEIILQAIECIHRGEFWFSPACNSLPHQ